MAVQNGSMDLVIHGFELLVNSNRLSLLALVAYFIGYTNNDMIIDF